MNKTYCDRCGAEIENAKNDGIHNKITVYSTGVTAIIANQDICQDCIDSCNNWWHNPQWDIAHDESMPDNYIGKSA